MTEFRRELTELDGFFDAGDGGLAEPEGILRGFEPDGVVGRERVEHGDAGMRGIVADADLLARKTVFDGFELHVAAATQEEQAGVVAVAEGIAVIEIDGGDFYADAAADETDGGAFDGGGRDGPCAAFAALCGVAEPGGEDVGREAYGGDDDCVAPIFHLWLA